MQGVVKDVVMYEVFLFVQNETTVDVVGRFLHPTNKVPLPEKETSQQLLNLFFFVCNIPF